MPDTTLRPDPPVTHDRRRGDRRNPHRGDCTGTRCPVCDCCQHCSNPCPTCTGCSDQWCDCPRGPIGDGHAVEWSPATGEHRCLACGYRGIKAPAMPCTGGES